jgi:hypothetical protein
MAGKIRTEPCGALIQGVYQSGSANQFFQKIKDSIDYLRLQDACSGSKA